MERPTFKLDEFEGSLDLLLFLTQKNKIDLLDIPMATITEQYTSYLAEMQSLDLDMSSDFLQMAAQLLYIKSKMLLPREKDEEDPRTELAEKLMEYQKVKEAAQLLSGVQNSAAELFFKPPEVLDSQKKPIENKSIPITKLLVAMVDIIERIAQNAPPPRKNFDGIVGREKVSVREISLFLVDRLEINGDMRFEELFNCLNSRAEIVAGFLAVLEMVKLGGVIVYYDEKNNLMIKNGDNYGIEINGIDN